MKNKLLVFIFMCLIFSLAIPKTKAADANTQGTNGESLSECTDCTTVWYSGYQAIRFTLVDKDFGWRIAGTKSIDYSNQYNKTDFFKNVWFNGYKSKLDHLNDISFSSVSNPSQGYATTKPIGSLPNLVGTNLPKNNDMETYLDNTFINTNSYKPLYQLLTDLGETKLRERIMAAAYGYRNLTEEEAWRRIVDTVLQSTDFKNYAFIVEPVIYIGARSDELSPTYLSPVYRGKTFAITPTEAAMIFPATKDECKVGTNYNSVCSSVTHKMLINALYLDGTDSQTGLNTQYYFSKNPVRKQASEIALFGNKNILESFPVGPYNLIRDVIGNNGTSPGIGLGYLDLIADIVNYCDPTKECCNPDGCEPVCTVNCGVTPVTNTPTCNIGGCGTTIGASDDTNWANIIGDVDHLENASNIGSKFLLTDWSKSSDLADVNSLKQVTSYFAPVYCRQNVTSSFPSTPSNQVYPGTYFNFDPVKMAIIKECYSEVNFEGWLKDYKESRRREAVAGINYSRSIDLSNSWKALRSAAKAALAKSVTNQEITASELATINSISVPGVNKGTATYCTTNWVAVPSSDVKHSSYTSPATYQCLIEGSRYTTTVGYKYTSTPSAGNFMVAKSANKCVRTPAYDTGKKMATPYGPAPIYAWDYNNQTTYSAVELVASVTTHTCTYGSASYTGTGAGSNTVGTQRAGWNGNSCYGERLVGYGAKFDSWTYSFNSSEIDESIVTKANFVGVSLGSGTYRVDSAYTLSSYKDSYGCLSDSEDKYVSSTNYWNKIYGDYTGRMKKLIDEVKPSNIFDWTVDTKSPTLSATHRQQTTAGVITNTYSLNSSRLDNPNPTGSRVTCDNTICSQVSTITGVNDLYGEITGRKETVYGYSLPSNTNKYRLKPSGEPSNFIATNGMYYDLGLPNYFVAANALTTSGSGSITLNYSGLGQNSYFDKKCGGGIYGSYTCPYNTSKCVGAGCDNPVNPRDFKYVYRTIDLDNPFPYKDGENRQPGYNWRAFPELVNNIITNNRGVKGDDIYTSGLTPMYSFDFTGSNRSKLMQIRNYNKQNKFQDIKEYGITCIAGKECRSTFLKNDMFRNVISGCGLNDNFDACSK